MESLGLCDVTPADGELLSDLHGLLSPAAANSGIFHFVTVSKSMQNREIKAVENNKNAFQFADAHTCRGIIRVKMHFRNILCHMCQTYFTSIWPTRFREDFYTKWHFYVWSAHHGCVRGGIRVRISTFPAQACRHGMKPLWNYIGHALRALPRSHLALRPFNKGLGY